MHTVEAEVLKAVGIKQKDGEDRQKFLVRVVRRLHELEDADFYSLSKKAQKWGNDAVTALDNGETIADFAKVNGKAGGHVTSEEKKELPMKPPKKKPITATKPKKAAATAAFDRGIKSRIKKMILKDPTVSVEDIMDALSKSGETPSKLTVTSIRSEFRHTLKLLTLTGHLKGIDFS